MSTRLQTLLLLANAIDLKREKLESALTDARRQQLAKQIDFLTKRFQSDYSTVMAENEPGDERVSRFHDKLDRLGRDDR